jgi:cell division protein ZapE
LLVEKGCISNDEAQRRGITQLQTAWEATHAHAKQRALWLQQHAAWELECERLQAEHQAKLDALKAKAKQAGKDDEDKPKCPVLVLPAAPVLPGLSTHGCYLWGDVGRGKSLLMDIFMLAFPSASTDAEDNGHNVRRLHFHEFMYDLHRQLHAPQPYPSGTVSARDKLSAIVSKIASDQPAVLCFDEFQITNIGDAPLLTKVFGDLFSQNVMVVMTSNRPPADLYHGGLRREAHLPEFVEALQSCMEVHHLDAELDYREWRRDIERTAASCATGPAVSAVPWSGDFIVSPERGSKDIPGSHGSAHANLTAAFEHAVGSHDIGPSQLSVAWGRTLECPEAAPGVAKFSFEELCGGPVSAEDYLALVNKSNVHTFVVADVPRFTLDLHNEARRFTNLVDCLYEHQCRLICSAASPPKELMSCMELLCNAEIKPEQPTPSLVSAESTSARKSHKHGDVTFESSNMSPCRPDTFATAEADAEAGTSVIHLSNSVGGDASDSADGVVGVMPAAVESLRESGFAARRCVSRIAEMGTEAYRAAHDARWHTKPAHCSH